jgi:tetratricopeptide (TPR) repeat protein
MKLWLNILVFFCLTIGVYAQDEMRVIDSLENVMAKQEGKERVETMLELSRAFVDFSFDDCISWGERAIMESKNLQDDELVAKAYWKIGLRYLHHYEFDFAHEQFVAALNVLDNRKEASEQLMDIMNYKGYVELYMGEIDSALATYRKTLIVSEALGDEANCADVYNGMAYLYFQQGIFDKAMNSFKEARQIYERLQDTLSVAQCDNNISNIYVERQQFDKALLLLQNVIPVFEQFNDEASLVHAYQNIGTVYATGHIDMDSALVYLKKSTLLAEKLGDRITLIEGELELGNVLKYLGKEKDAINLYQSALHSSQTIGFTKGMLEAYKNLGIHYNEIGDFTTSAIYLRRCMELSSDKGNQLYVNTVRPYLIADYARLGQLMEMKKELGLMLDNYDGIINENNALDEELTEMRYHTEGLLKQHESQNAQIQALQSQRDHYRLAFFGLLAIALFVLVLFVAYKIVRKKRAKV